MIELKDLVGWGVAIVIAIIGVSSIYIFLNQKKENNNVNQTITNGNNNNLAGGDIIIGKNDEE